MKKVLFLLFTALFCGVVMAEEAVAADTVANTDAAANAVVVTEEVVVDEAAQQAKMQEVAKLLKGRNCPLAALQGAIGEDASYIGANGDTYLLAEARTQQDCPTIVQYLLDNGAIDTIYSKDEQNMMAMAYFETDYVHHDEQPGKYKGNKSAQLFLTYITDPTYRLLNHTFWRSTTPEELATLLPVADINTPVTAFADYQKVDSLYAIDYAIESMRPELVSLLLEQSPLLDRQNATGLTPLMRAAKWYGDDTISQIIAAAPATVNLRDKNGFSALNYAEQCTNGNTVCNPSKSKLVLAAMTDPTAKMLSYTYWLTATADQVKADIAAGADVNASVNTELGRQPVLWFAVVASSDYKAIQVLFANKVQKRYGTAANNIFDTVSYFRIHKDRDTMINFLMKNGIRKP